ncbi:cytochrome P450 family protein, partial [Rhizoctonia solani AG-3 Rhs1AP]
MPDEPLAIGLIVVTSLLAYQFYHYNRERKLSLPPSPRSYPLIGHLLSVPKEFEHLGFVRIGEQLGSKIFSLNVFGTTIIVLNNKDDAANLFDKRSAIYSDRTCPPMVKDPSLLNWGDIGVLIGFGDRWRKYRRLMNPWLTKHAVIKYQGSQEKATRELLQRLLKSSNEVMCSHKLDTELYLSVSATLFRSLYGYEAESSNDPILVRTQRVIAYLANAILASSYLVNKIPALRYIPAWFPGAGWKRNASQLRKEKDSLIDELYNIGLGNIKKDENSRLMITSLRSQALKLGLTEEEVDDYVKQVLIIMVGGGTDTTVNTLLMFFSAMVLYPEVQKKAQEELDSVIGNTRLPTIEDRDQLRYIEMIMQETFRWAPVSALGKNMDYLPSGAH